MRDEMNDLQMPYTDPNPGDLVRVVRCRNCKYRNIDEKYGAMCDLDTGDPYSLGRNAEEDDWFCKDGKSRIKGD